MMDANGTVFDEQLSRALAEDGLEMKEVVHSTRSGPGPKTYFRGAASIQLTMDGRLAECSSADLSIDENRCY